MTDQEIKIMFSRKVLVIQDKSVESTLRYILFGTHNTIDWQEAYQVALTNMPELINYKPD